LNRGIACIVVLMIGLVGALAYVISDAQEDVVVNTTTSSGKIIFQDSTSRGVFFLGEASADFGANTTSSNAISLIETGMEVNTFTASWRNDQEDKPGSTKKATFTLAVWDPAGILHSTTQESEGIHSGTLSVSCSPFEPGEGRFELTSTIHERRLNVSAVFDH